MADVTLEDRKAMYRGEKAKQLLDNAEFSAAVEAVRTALHQKFDQTPVRDTEGMQVIRLQLKCLDDVIANVQHVINTGKVVQDRITWFEKLKQRATHGSGR